MKNKYGFTLVELLAVVILIGVISVVTVPVVKNSIKDSKQKAYEKQINIILESAKKWATLNTEQLPDNGAILVEMDTLKKEGLLENKKIINPINNKEINACVTITYDNTHNQYAYVFNEGCEEITKTLAELVTITKNVPTIPSCITNKTICTPGTPLGIEVNDEEIYDFYVIDDTEEEITLILDRNLGPKAPWISEEDYLPVGKESWIYEIEEEICDEICDDEEYCEDDSCGQCYEECYSETFEYEGSNSVGPLTAVDILKTRTSGWYNIQKREYTYSDDGGGNKYTSFKETMRARMLTQTEASKFGCTTSNESCPTWLVTNLSNKGDGNHLGYWLSAAYATTREAVVIEMGAKLSRLDVYNSIYGGIRPVITIKK